MKSINGRYLPDEEIKEKFKYLSLLKHKNIIKYIKLDIENKFIIAEFIEGLTLG